VDTLLYKLSMYRVCHLDIFCGVSKDVIVSLRLFDTPWYTSIFQQYFNWESVLFFAVHTCVLRATA